MPWCQSVCPSVRLSVTEVHWRIIADLGFKFRSHFTAHWPKLAAAAVLLASESSRAMLASARVSCWIFPLLSAGGKFTHIHLGYRVKMKHHTFIMHSITQCIKRGVEQSSSSTEKTRNTWQPLTSSPFGVATSPPSEYLWNTSNH